MISTKQISATILLGVSVTLLSTSNAEALDFTFTKLVDTSTPIPGGGGVFSNFDYFTPALDNGTVAFWAESRSGQPGNYTYSQGIYTHTAGTIKKVVDTFSLIPGSSNTFSYLGQPSIDQDGNIAFWGALLNPQKTGYANWGIYTYTGGSSNLIADKTTPVPDGSGRRFDSFNQHPSIDSGKVVFSGMDNGGLQAREGIYTSSGGVLNQVVAQGTPMPGGGTFSNFPFAASLYPNAAIDSGNIVFLGQGNGNTAGVYVNKNGTLEKIADHNTPNSPSYGKFAGFRSPSIDNNDVVFVGTDIHNSIGIYTDIAEQLHPLTNAHINFPDAPSIDNGNIAFVNNVNNGDANSGYGLYTTLGGALTKVLKQGELLDGKQWTHIFAGRESLSGNSIAFQVRFADGYTQAIYIAEAQSIQSVPTPALLPGLLAFGAQIWKRRRQQENSMI